jgi:hypothetical protein
MAFPGFTARVRGPLLIAEGTVQPTEISDNYRVRIEFEAACPPKVWVISPALCCREGADRIPHMYDQKRLCLYMPGSGEWIGNMSLGHTLIPWISVWLFYYELWHGTGEWLGGGHETNLTGPYPEEEEREITIDENTRRRG